MADCASNTLPASRKNPDNHGFVSAVAVCAG
jgi:hypothetical protein